MVGIVFSYKQSDWVGDMQLAKSKGITGFALNIGVDSYSQDQLDLAYSAAEQVGGFELFISFDFNWYSVSDTAGVASMMGRYINKPAQLLVDGKPFVSSFIGDGFNWGIVAQILGKEIYAVPFNQPSATNANDPGVKGLFSWAAWPGQLDNQPIKQNMTLNRDDDYLNVLDAAGKQYMAPVSPWCEWLRYLFVEHN
jgi:glucan endo-1,3-alpha-glucosidase